MKPVHSPFGLFRLVLLLVCQSLELTDAQMWDYLNLPPLVLPNIPMLLPIPNAQQQPSLNGQTSVTAMHRSLGDAAAVGDLTKVRNLANLGTLDLNWLDRSGMVNCPSPYPSMNWTALYRGIACNNNGDSMQEIVKTLIGNGASVGALDESRGTPLHLAGWFGYPNIATQLLNAGADINAVDYRGASPVTYATQQGHLPTVGLLQNFQNRGMFTVYKFPALTYAPGFQGFQIVSFSTTRRPQIVQVIPPRPQPQPSFSNGQMSNVALQRSLGDAAALGDVATVRNLLNLGKLDANYKDRGSYNCPSLYPTMPWTPLARGINCNTNQNSMQEVVRMLLNRGASVGPIDQSRGTPLHMAAWFGYQNVVTQLLDAGGSVNAKDCRGATPLTYALQEGNSPTVRLLVSRGAENYYASSNVDYLTDGAYNCPTCGHAVTPDPYYKPNIGSGVTRRMPPNPFLYSDEQCPLPETGLLLNRQRNDETLYPSINAVNTNFGQGQIVYPPRQTQLTTVGPLPSWRVESFQISSGTEDQYPNRRDARVYSQGQYSNQGGNKLNVYNPPYYQPLIPATLPQFRQPLTSTAVMPLDMSEHSLVQAAFRGDLFTIQRLLGVGQLNVNWREPGVYSTGCILPIRNGTALHLVTACNQQMPGTMPQIVQQLLDSGANVNAMELGSNRTALMLASANGNRNTVQLLADRGADISGKDANGMTPLMYAVKNGSLELVRFLVERGADVNERDKKGETALHKAVIASQPDIVKMLLLNRAAVNLQDDQGNTPLIYAVTYGFSDVVKMLLDMGADVNKIKNSHGKTALDVATDVPQIINNPNDSRYGWSQQILKMLQDSCA